LESLSERRETASTSEREHRSGQRFFVDDRILSWRFPHTFLPRKRQRKRSKTHLNVNSLFIPSSLNPVAFWHWHYWTIHRVVQEYSFGRGRMWEPRETSGRETTRKSSC